MIQVIIAFHIILSIAFPNFIQIQIISVVLQIIFVNFLYPLQVFIQLGQY
jgi:hypothetical protein